VVWPKETDTVLVNPGMGIQTFSGSMVMC